MTSHEPDSSSNENIILRYSRKAYVLNTLMFLFMTLVCLPVGVSTATEELQSAQNNSQIDWVVAFFPLAMGLLFLYGLIKYGGRLFDRRPRLELTRRALLDYTSSTVQIIPWTVIQKANYYSRSIEEEESYTTVTLTLVDDETVVIDMTYLDMPSEDIFQLINERIRWGENDAV